MGLPWRGLKGSRGSLAPSLGGGLKGSRGFLGSACIVCGGGFALVACCPEFESSSQKTRSLSSCSSYLAGCSSFWG